MSSRPWFLRVFVALLVAVLASQALGALLVFGRFQADRSDLVRQAHHSQLTELASVLTSLPPVERAAAVERFRGSTGLPVELRPGSQQGRPPPKLAGRPPLVVEVGGGQVLRLRPPPGGPPPPGLGMLALQLSGVVGIVAVIGWLLARPIVRDLHSLEQTVERFGHDQLDARATVPSSGPVRSLAAGVNQMADRVQQLVTSQQQLLQAVSHELRTPNARLRFLLEALRDADDPALRESLIQSAESDIEEVDALLGELLAYLRLGVNTQTLAVSCSVKPVLEELVTRCATLREGVELQLQCAPELKVAVSERWFGRAIENLLTNAVRHAAQRVRVQVTEGEGGLAVWVDDDGEGVPEGERLRIFQPFTAGDPSRSKQLGGVGLGLAIVARILERHGGQVVVADSDLGGASFRTCWPSQIEAPKCPALGVS